MQIRCLHLFIGSAIVCYCCCIANNIQVTSQHYLSPIPELGFAHELDLVITWVLHISCCHSQLDKDCGLTLEKVSWPSEKLMFHETANRLYILEFQVLVKKTHAQKSMWYPI